jgi:hypothetical protein
LTNKYATLTVHVSKILEELPKDMEGTATTPAVSHLFQIRDESMKLDEEAAQFFHSTVAKVLFLCKPGQPDLQRAVAFLCTRVHTPAHDDQAKLTRTMKYLRGTKHLGLRLHADNLNIVKWWVDTAFAVQNDMRSHTGGAMSLGAGVYTLHPRNRK